MRNGEVVWGKAQVTVLFLLHNYSFIYSLICVLFLLCKLYIAIHRTKHHGVIRRQKSSQHWQVKIGLSKTYSPYASLPKKLLASWGYLEISYSKIVKQQNYSKILMLLIQTCSSVTKWWDTDPVKEEVCVLLTMDVKLGRIRLGAKIMPYLQLMDSGS